MPTQEERLAIVEQAITESQRFQREAADHIRDTEENTTILLGVIRSQGQDIKRIFTRLETIDQRLGEHTQIFSEQAARLDRVDTRLDRIETLLTQILARLPQQPE